MQLISLILTLSCHCRAVLFFFFNGAGPVSYGLWNLCLSHLVFRKKDGELKLYVYDLLDQNRSLIRNVTDTYVEDVPSRVLKRYFMLSFTDNLRNFAGTAPRGMMPGSRSPGGIPGQGGGRGRGNRSF